MRFGLFIFLLLLISCSKNNEGNCPSYFEISANTITPTVGETLILTAFPDNNYYKWSGPLNYFNHQTSGVNTISLTNIKINQSGWYHSSLVGTGCEVLYDSIYIDVKYKQGNPACQLTDNRVIGNNVPNLQASYISKTVEPKDGIYMTRGTRAFSPFDDANTIFGECRYANYYFQTLPDQEVYVSHVNGKLRISFCNLVYGGDDGTSTMFSSTFSGQLTENR